MTQQNVVDPSDECICCKPAAKDGKSDSESSLLLPTPVALSTEKSVDIFRDTPVRLLGYANEVGEAFRALVPVGVVRLSYVIAAGYVLVDTVDKSFKVMQLPHQSAGQRSRATAATAADTLIWQTLASVLIPGLTINRACALSHVLLARGTRLPSATRKWITTALGLACIPFIVHPIDQGCHWLLDRTLRPQLRPWMLPTLPPLLEDSTDAAAAAATVITTTEAPPGAKSGH